MEKLILGALGIFLMWKFVFWVWDILEDFKAFRICPFCGARLREEHPTKKRMAWCDRHSKWVGY